MSITFEAKGVQFPNIKKQKLSSWINNVIEKHHKRTGEISYLFCDDEKMLEANRDFLQHDFYTDIITFDYSEEETISGDILISLDTVMTNSNTYGTTFEEELHRVIIHGILHLCGLSDLTPEEEKVMRDAENDALKMLKGYNIIL